MPVNGASKRQIVRKHHPIFIAVRGLRVANAHAGSGSAGPPASRRRHAAEGAAPPARIPGAAGPPAAPAARCVASPSSHSKRSRDIVEDQPVEAQAPLERMTQCPAAQHRMAEHREAARLSSAASPGRRTHRPASGRSAATICHSARRKSAHAGFAAASATARRAISSSSASRWRARTASSAAATKQMATVPGSGRPAGARGPETASIDDSCMEAVVYAMQRA